MDPTDVKGNPVITSRRRESGSPSRWDPYRELLVAKRIPGKAQRWHVAHVEQFHDALKPASLTQLSAEQMTGYLRQASSTGQWQDWQFRQLVDALRLLLVDFAQVKAAQAVDWDYWGEAGAALAADHPTIAREKPPEARLRPPRFAASAEGFPILATLARTLRTHIAAMWPRPCKISSMACAPPVSMSASAASKRSPDARHSCASIGKSIRYLNNWTTRFFWGFRADAVTCSLGLFSS